jgi:hypothetical protein
MKQGDCVRISGAAGVVNGRVEELRTPAELPELPDLSIGPVRDVLAEIECTRVAILSYAYGREHTKLIFAALECDGQWYDLRNQELTIETLEASR